MRGVERTQNSEKKGKKRDRRESPVWSKGNELKSSFYYWLVLPGNDFTHQHKKS